MLEIETSASYTPGKRFTTSHIPDPYYCFLKAVFVKKMKE